MKYDEFKRQIGKAGLTIQEFASLVKTNPSSITNFRTRGRVPKNMAIIVTLMGEMADGGMDFREPLSKLDIEQLPAKTEAFGVKKQPQ